MLNHFFYFTIYLQVNGSLFKKPFKGQESWDLRDQDSGKQGKMMKGTSTVHFFSLKVFVP
jgi:hypothetical protein